MNGIDLAPATTAGWDGSGARRAALLVHALAAPDRVWLLRRVGTDQRALLERLLGEIEALGIDGIASAVPDLLRSEITGPEASAAAAPAADVDNMSVAALAARIAQLGPARLSSLLRGEPDRLVARVLSHSGRVARSTFLRGVEPARRNALASRGDSLSQRGGPGSASRLEQALLAALLRRDTSLPQGPTAARSPGAWLSASLRRGERRPTALGASR